MIDRLDRESYSRTYLSWLCASIGPRRGRLLEVGAHTGQVAREAATAGFDSVALDLDPAVLRGLPGATPAVVADVHRLPHRAAAFDVVAMFDVIEHLASPWAALVEIRRVLHPGGHLCLTTPNLKAVDQYVHPRSWSGVADPAHLYLFSRRSLAHLLRMASLEVVSVRTPFHSLHPRVGRLLAPTGLGGQLWVHARAGTGRQRS